jgi:PhoH-like ATPase
MGSLEIGYVYLIKKGIHLMEEKRYVLDTNILINDPLAIFRFENNHVYIPITVLEELDAIKDRNIDVSRDARAAISTISKVVEGCKPEELVSGLALSRYSEGSTSEGKLYIFSDYGSLVDLPRNKFHNNTHANQDNDDLIIAVALTLQTKHPEDKVALVTKDLNMRIKSIGDGLKYAEDFRSDVAIDDLDYLASGYHLLDGSFWDEMALGILDTAPHPDKPGVQLHKFRVGAFPNAYLNQYIYDEGESFLGRVVQVDEECVLIEDIGVKQAMSKSLFGIKPRNIKQAMAFDALINPNITIVQLTGAAGSGKSLLALAYAMEASQIGTSLNPSGQRLYNKTILTRNTTDIAENIGFLPGTEEEKLAPYLASFEDAMEVMLSPDNDDTSSEEKGHGSFKNQQHTTVQYAFEQNNVQMKSVNFLRGRSLNQSCLILDEGQNLSSSQMKAVITRIGAGSKMIITGNLNQIDARFLDANSSGLTHAVERLKKFAGSAVIHLDGVQRSELAEFAEENL